MWAFPEPNREIDIAVAVLSVLIAFVVILQTIFLPSLLEGFIGTFPFWQFSSILLLVFGCGLIFVRKPNYWVYGLIMGGILFIGSLLSLLISNSEYLHLVQLTAYPLLLVLGDRFPIGEKVSSDHKQEDSELRRQRVSVDYQTLELIRKLFNEKDPTGILYKIAQATCHLILADLTLVIDTPDKHGKISSGEKCFIFLPVVHLAIYPIYPRCSSYPSRGTYWLHRFMFPVQIKPSGWSCSLPFRTVPGPKKIRTI
jgi:hypothetical protein